MAPQVLTEFVHLITEPRRFERPLSVAEATERANRWWNGAETNRVYPKDSSVELFSRWMLELSRVRLNRGPSPAAELLPEENRAAGGGSVAGRPRSEPIAAKRHRLRSGALRGSFAAWGFDLSS